jgi:uncharacterized iron-regulated membrane protein
MTPVKKFILFCHRWLGFISGIIVFIVSITGCIFCFQDEIQDAFYSHRKVEIQNKPYIQPSTIVEVFKQKYPKGSADYIYYYGKGRPAGIFANMGEKEGYWYVFLNPYSGQITHTEKVDENFFVIVEYIHLYLLLPPAIGSVVVGTAVLIFVIIMITGIILWWPKRKTDRKRSFTIKWNGRWRRVNYDLHNVLGFYATSIALILAITGLSMSFEWVRDGIYKTANLGKDYPSERVIPKSDSLQISYIAKQPVIDQAYLIAKQRSPKAEMYLIYNNQAVSGAIEATAFAKTLRYYESDSYMFDRYTGKLLRTMPHVKKSAGMKMNEMNYDLHVGQIFGLTTKIIAFLASLICASLPVTGFIIWWGKRKKSKSKATNKQVRAIVHRKTHKQHVAGV